VCELARKNPKNYLSLAPIFFDLLNSSNRNNWMLIKIIKLFAALTPLEQRLARLLVEPMHQLINSTPATSLLYECIQCCIAGLSAHLPTMKLCIGKLRGFIEEPDQNLKYLGLVALHSIMKIHPKAVAEHGDLVMGCLSDEDATIRARALDLLSGIASKKNLREIVTRLMEHIAHAEGAYRDDLLVKAVELCHAGQYANVVDFEWYLGVLIEMSRIQQSTRHGKLLASQLLDVAVRVCVVRPYAARLMISLLRDPRFTANPVEGGICELLDTAAWIVGEFYRHAVAEIPPLELLELLLQPRVASLPASIQATFVQNALKVFAKMASGDCALKPTPEEIEAEEDAADGPAPFAPMPASADDALQGATILIDRLPLFAQSAHTEVQERACLALELARLYAASANAQALGVQLFALFDETMLPVAKTAQRKVPVPEGLDLDTPIFPDEPEPAEPEETPDDGSFAPTQSDYEELRRMGATADAQYPVPSAAARKRAGNPFILGNKEPGDDIPMQQITENLGELHVSGSAGNSVAASHHHQQQQQRKAPARKPKVYRVMTDEERPEGADAEEEGREEEKKKKVAEPGDALADISLDEPLRPGEALPVATHRVVPITTATPAGAVHVAASPVAATSPKPAAVAIARPGTKANPSPYILTDVSAPSEQPIASSPSTRKPLTTQQQPQQQRKPKAPVVASLIDLGMDAPAPAQKPAVAAVAASAPMATTSAPQKGKKLCNDGTLDVCVDFKTNPNEKFKLLAVLRITNQSASEAVTKIEVVAPDAPAIQLVHMPRFERVAFSLAAGASNTHQLLLTFPKATVAMTLRGELRYMVGSAARTLPFELVVPASTFISPVVFTKDELANMIRTEGAALSVAKCMVRSAPTAAAATAAAVAKGVLHLEPVAMPSTAGRFVFYGRTLHGLHVALLVRDKTSEAEGALQFELKTSDQSLTHSLAAEINAFGH